MSAVIRVVSFMIPDWRAMNIPEEVMEVADVTHGMIIVTGTANSGKSTTQACIIDKINHTRNAHIITLEDPIEFLHRNSRSFFFTTFETLTKKKAGDSFWYLRLLCFFCFYCKNLLFVNAFGFELFYDGDAAFISFGFSAERISDSGYHLAQTVAECSENEKGCKGNDCNEDNILDERLTALCLTETSSDFRFHRTLSPVKSVYGTSPLTSSTVSLLSL